ncbi:hypothetical protein BGW36DRAFT_362840 [Talaromyces proteolyticus]|uniref:Uncharacterized protein n=1 Tax=Talaromyces proteolyticus TaxID=1131652 RepID=A0AAD4KGP9_9EURO|nr:uncharacterized protein BGW36DRAFT_362840 [Talaromyces proteolyticus]KAH8691804.1 hypothetical protein BGW36DRAFT_362840 [Talaromyces proteolyticus]
MEVADGSPLQSAYTTSLGASQQATMLDDIQQTSAEVEATSDHRAVFDNTPVKSYRLQALQGVYEALRILRASSEPTEDGQETQFTYFDLKMFHTKLEHCRISLNTRMLEENKKIRRINEEVSKTDMRINEKLANLENEFLSDQANSADYQRHVSRESLYSVYTTMMTVVSDMSLIGDLRSRSRRALRKKTPDARADNEADKPDLEALEDLSQTLLQLVRSAGESKD